MKLLFPFCLASFLFLVAEDEIYTVPLKTIDGTAVDLGVYQGKKMLIVVLPGSSEDSRMTVSKLDSLAGSRQDSLVIIGVPAKEWGYSDTVKSQLKNLYQSLPANFILAEGMQVQKEGPEQSPLFQWLTQKNKNGFHDRDVPDIGEKFFIDEKGKLYGVLSANLKLDSPLMERILNRTRPSQQ